MLKNYFKFYIIIFTLISNISFAAEKIAFIDLNVIFDNSIAGKNINSQVREKQKKINASLKKFQETFKSDREKLKKQKNVLSKEEYKKKFVALDKDLKAYNFSIKKRNDELTNFQIRARAEFFNKLRPILEEYSKQNEISLILKKENILIGKTNLDISKTILDMFDKQIKKISIN
tara:strand:+ start:114 stop:638 length:525 start_codon:yes stop_codon:yes gene_type:complete